MTEQLDPSNPVDMSAPAILRRLEQVAQLYELGIYLSKARFAPAKDTKAQGDVAPFAGAKTSQQNVREQ